MKTYKEITQSINESEATDGGGLGLPTSDSYGRSAHNDVGLHNIAKPEQLKRLNAFLSAFTQKEFLDPRQALNVMRTKLNIAGYDFPMDKSVDIPEDGTTSFRLSRYGGTFGKSVDTPIDDFDDTDGFADGESYVLETKIVDVPNGLYKLEVEIKEGEEAEIEPESATDSQKLHKKEEGVTPSAGVPGSVKENFEVTSFNDYRKNESETE